MTAQAVLRFHDAGLAAALDPVVADGAISWEEFFAAAERLSALDPAELQHLQYLLVAALTDGDYDLAPPTTDAMVTFLHDDDTGAEIVEHLARLGFETVMVPAHADLSWAIRSLDDLRRTRGPQGVRRVVDGLVRGDGAGHTADRRLIRLLPRAYRTATNEVMPGYRVYGEEELAAGGVEAFRGAVIEVAHDGVPGLLAHGAVVASAFELRDRIRRGLDALGSATGNLVLLRVHAGAPVAVDDDSDPAEGGEGRVLFRGPIAVPDADSDWQQAVLTTMMRPVRRVRPMPAAQVWELLGQVPGDPETVVRQATSRLAGRSPSAIRAFDAGLRALAHRLDRADVRSAAEVEFGWLSSDAFEDIRLGVLASGPEVYAAAISEPARLDWSRIGPAEELLSIAPDAYRRRTGEELDPDESQQSTPLTGTTVLSSMRTKGGEEVCVTWWGAGAVERRDRAAENGSDRDGRAEILTVQPDPPPDRLRPEFHGIVLTPLR